MVQENQNYEATNEICEMVSPDKVGRQLEVKDKKYNYSNTILVLCLEDDEKDPEQSQADDNAMIQ